MMILTDFDLMDTIKNVNKPMGPFKVVRNQRKIYGLYFPLISATAFIFEKCLCNDIELNQLLKNYLNMCAGGMAGSLLMNYIEMLINHDKKDVYASNAIKKLKTLSLALKELNVNTDYELLLKSELYEKEVEPDFSKSVLPSIVVNKYFYVPSYDYNGEETETSLLQEHVIGSKEYILSVGEPHKKYKRVLSKSLS